MNILGISAFYHDSAAALLCDGEVIAAVQEERFTREKNDPAFPVNAIRFCLEYAGLSVNDLDAVAYYDKPFLKFERLLETYYGYAPRGLGSFIRSMPVWIKEKLFLKQTIYKEMGKLGGRKKPLLLFPEHHLSHAASAYYVSPFPEAAILTLDGVGEWATATIMKGEGNDIRVLKQQDFPHSPGLLYSAFTYYCGFAVNSGEYKLMGLAPYGNRENSDYRRFAEIIRTRLVDLREDGSLFLYPEYFEYATGNRMVNDRVWMRLFGFPRRKAGASLEQAHCDMALAIQDTMEEIVLRLAREAKRLTGSDRLCMAGGVALNCVANGQLERSHLFSEIFVQPAAGDAGGALGAATAAHHLYFGCDRKMLPGVDGMKGSLLGPAFSAAEILRASRRYAFPYQLIEDTGKLVEKTARLIAEGGVVGWFQGRTEFGPRALGARSILADARDPEMQKRLNLTIKGREGFRPFAPAVLAEKAADYFEAGNPSPYMLMVRRVVEERRKVLPEGYARMRWNEKLAVRRSELPAITHIDYSARIQTVDEQAEPRFRKLLEVFQRITGCAVVINTSFNVRDEPIVNTPEDAFRCFQRTGMDWLVIGDFIFGKKD